MCEMAMRVQVYNEFVLNESEQDANSVLTELDKGLRSTKIGIQCEAIVRFPRLFEKYPFPILINSSFLKLAEFFWNGSNLLRFWVLRVCQQSENHLDKILNIDAFVKRIFMVIHSNDHVARALTLRTLGAISRVIPEKQQVHHAIRKALDSHNTVEVEAAIYASGQFASQSRTFAISMCAKISDMIESLQIPVPMKLQLIPVLRYMHHDSNTASIVKELCLNLLPKYPADSFVLAILDSLTSLSSRTLTMIPEQVALLLSFLQDFRICVRAQALKSLIALTDAKCVHAWSNNSIEDLINKARDCRDPREQYLYMCILIRLSQCPLTCYILLTNCKRSIIELCTLSQDITSTSSCQAIVILATILSFSPNTQDSNEILQVLTVHIEGILYCALLEQTPDNLKNIMKSAMQVAMINNGFGVNFVNLLVDILSDEIHYPTTNILQLCNGVRGICSQFLKNKLAMTQDNMKTEIPSIHDQLITILDRFANLTLINPTQDQLQTIEIISSVLLQSLIGGCIPFEAITIFEKCCHYANSWTQYRLARSASRYGHHYLSAYIISNITRNTLIDKLYFFLRALLCISKAECILNYGVEYATIRENYGSFMDSVKKSAYLCDRIPLILRLEAAINLYFQALSNLRASATATNPLNFQIEFIKIRAQLLQALHMTVTIKSAQVIVTPPAIATTLAQTTRDSLQKFGHITNQLRKLVKIFKTCEESFSRLYKSAFDADPTTLEFIEISEHICALMAYIIERICYASSPEPPIFRSQCNSPETCIFYKSCYNMKLLLENLPTESAEKTISSRHLEVLVAEVEIICSTPICLPRYFYQNLQSTQIKLSVSPQPRSPGEPVIVQAGSNLVIKVEGVIQHYRKNKSLYRNVEYIQISLTSLLITSSRSSNENIKLPNESVSLIQTVKPHRNFISVNFLLPISHGGQWQVFLDTSVIDENGITWCTGPRLNMVVRVLEDPNKPVQTTTMSNATRRY